MKVSGENFTTQFNGLGTTTIPAEGGTIENAWHAINAKGTMTFPFSSMSAEEIAALTCRFYLSVKDKTINYNVDHAFLVPAATVKSSMELNGMVLNGNFEIPTTSPLWALSEWQSSGSSTFETISDGSAPAGTSYIKNTNRISDEDLITYLQLPNSWLENGENSNQLIEIRYWAKFNYQDEAVDAASIGEDRHNALLTKVTVTHDPLQNGNEVQFHYQCHKACMIPDGKWRQYHATCNIGREIKNPSKECITGDCEGDGDGTEPIGDIKAIKWFIRTRPTWNGPGDGIDISLDQVEVKPFVRNRDWVAGANLRIRELRTQPVKFNVVDAPAGSTLEIKMKKNLYPFGGKFGWDQYALDGINGTMDTGIQDEWKYYFNYGYCTNEMKWQATERVKGIRDYTKGDAIRELFDEWNIPLSGNTLLWEVPNKATPHWYREELLEHQEAGTSPEALSEYIMFHINDTMTHFKGKNTNYKLINEPAHGNEFRTSYNDIWNRTLAL